MINRTEYEKTEKKYTNKKGKSKITDLLEDMEDTVKQIQDKTKLYNAKIPRKNRKGLLKGKAALIKKQKIQRLLLLKYLNEYLFLLFSDISRLEEQIKKIRLLIVPYDVQEWAYESLLRDLFVNIFKTLFDRHDKALSLKSIHSDILVNKILKETLRIEYKEAYIQTKIKSKPQSDFSSVEEIIKFPEEELDKTLKNIETIFNGGVARLIRDLRNEKLCHNQAAKKEENRELKNIFEEEIIKNNILSDIFKTTNHIKVLMTREITYWEPI